MTSGQIYNADTASPSEGAPLLRSTLFLAAPGNRDIASRDLGKTPDGLAYFYYWSQPLNGPVAAEGSPLVAPVVGPEENKKAFLEGAGKAFPRMANFSIDQGNAHWTVLDANATVDWTDRDLQDWVAKDLEAARGARWRFVSFHQPGFNSSKTHFDEQYMRILAPIFSRPARSMSSSTAMSTAASANVSDDFRPGRGKRRPEPRLGPDGKPSKARRVGGKWTLDKTFDGKSDTTPEGVNLRRDRRRRSAPVQPRATGQPGLVAGVHLQAYFQEPFAQRGRDRRPDPDAPSAHGRRLRGRPLRHHEMIRGPDEPAAAHRPRPASPPTRSRSVPESSDGRNPSRLSTYASRKSSCVRSHVYTPAARQPVSAARSSTQPEVSTRLINMVGCTSRAPTTCQGKTVPIR